MKLMELAAAGIVFGVKEDAAKAAGIAAAWGLAHGIPVTEIKWEEIPAENRSYVSEEE